MRALRGVLALGLVTVQAGGVGRAALAQGVPQLEITTDQGCGAGAVFPASQAINATVRATGIPEGQSITVQLTFINALNQHVTASVHLSSTAPETVTSVPAPPYPLGPVQIQGRIAGHTDSVTCEVTAADITPAPTASPTVTATVTPTENPSLTPTGIQTVTPTSSQTASASFTPTPSPTATSSATARLVTATPSVKPSTTPSPSPTHMAGGLLGDANCDGSVSAADITRQAVLLGTASRAPCGLDDATGNGTLDAHDIDAAVAIIFGG